MLRALKDEVPSQMREADQIVRNAAALADWPKSARRLTIRESNM
jgi:hypothetical protein